ncbi:MAG: ATP-dependent DNA helicase RecG [Lachnospiraceae bacterium]|nr:ATP-dependent DNA helicase RecG [Lachnospiraceae bacterium]
MSILDSNIINIKGIGEKTAALFEKAGIKTYEDLISYFPRDYVRYEEALEVTAKELDKTIAFEAIVLKRPLMRRAGRLTITSCPLKTSDPLINAVWFHMPYLSKSLKVGGRYIFYGQIYLKGSQLCIDQALIFTKEQYDEIKNTLQPVYPLVKGLTNQMLKKGVKQLLDQLKGMEETDLYRSMHFPKDLEDLRRAREKFVYEEFFFYILRLRALKEDNMRARNNFSISPVPEIRNIIAELPYELTKAQLKVLSEIEGDLTRGLSMNRLVQGDVGCGKTIIAFLAALMVALNGYQAAIMAPTEILAGQHYEGLLKLISKSGLKVEVLLLTGSMKAAEKKRIYKKIGSKEADIIIGTHALIQEKAEYSDLALVITDEQHRFGVKQRDALVNKNMDNVPHVLVMSATPIPRTLAMILYGDLDISVIDEIPSRRLKIKSCVVNERKNSLIIKYIKEELKLGHQAYIICPLVEESEGVEAKDVINYTEVLRQSFGHEVRIECLHGRLKAKEKQDIMEDFYNNSINILVSTTVVEVGVNVPNATFMVVENSERFGLAQLHQLRGRIGRGEAQSYCVFVDGKDNEDSRKRLGILAESTDGFYIAREDLKLRGPGDFFGIRQSGDMKFKLGDIYTDAAILKKASEDVEKLLKEDRELKLEKNRPILEKLEKISERDVFYSL